MKTHINSKLLREWLAADPKRSMDLLVKKTKLSEHTLYKMINGGYRSLPNALTRSALCQATGLEESELFNLIEDAG